MFSDTVLANYKHVYLFDGVGVRKVTRDKQENFEEVYYKCTTDTCECPAGRHDVVCRHRKMLMQTFATKKMINTTKLSQVLSKYEQVTFGARVTHSVYPGCQNIISRRPQGEEPYHMIVAIEHTLPLYWIFT